VICSQQQFQNSLPSSKSGNEYPVFSHDGVQYLQFWPVFRPTPVS